MICNSALILCLLHPARGIHKNPSQKFEKIGAIHLLSKLCFLGEMYFPEFIYTFFLPDKKATGYWLGSLYTRTSWTLKKTKFDSNLLFRGINLKEKNIA
jgi:hypothetical protein